MITVWVYVSYNQWTPTDFTSKAAAIDFIESGLTHGNEFRITRELKLSIKEPEGVDGVNGNTVDS